MNTNRNKERIADLIEKYYEGATSSAEEKELVAYFSSKNVSAELRGEQSYFQALGELKNRQTADKKQIYSLIKRYSLANFARITTVAASVALLVVGGVYLQATPKNYVIIDGKKYTDKEKIEQVFFTSMQNVKQNSQEIFGGLGDITQW